jgi:hypothetical protein
METAASSLGMAGDGWCRLPRAPLLSTQRCSSIEIQGPSDIHLSTTRLFLSTKRGLVRSPELGRTVVAALKKRLANSRDRFGRDHSLVQNPSPVSFDTRPKSPLPGILDKQDDGRTAWRQPFPYFAKIICGKAEITLRRHAHGRLRLGANQ